MKLRAGWIRRTFLRTSESAGKFEFGGVIEEGVIELWVMVITLYSILYTGGVLFNVECCIRQL